MSKIVTKEEILKRLNNIKDFRSEYFIDEESITGVTKKSKFRHSCGYEFEMVLKDFIYGQRCPECARKIRHSKATEVLNRIRKNDDFNKKLTPEEYFNRINKKFNNEFLLIDHSVDFKRQTGKLTLKHTNCGEIFSMKARFMLEGKKNPCPFCYHYGRKNSIEYIKESLKKCSFELLNEEEYKTTHSNLQLRCLKCNKIQKRSFNTIVNLGGKCDCSKRSFFGENVIAEFLQENNISYTQNASKEGLYDKGNLKIDFLLDFKNVIIEYDGVQHFEPNEFYTHDTLEDIQRRDKIKNDFAIKNSYEIIRISYRNNTEKKIRDILRIFFNYLDGKPYDWKQSRTVWVGGKSEPFEIYQQENRYKVYGGV